MFTCIGICYFPAKYNQLISYSYFIKRCLRILRNNGAHNVYCKASYKWQERNEFQLSCERLRRKTQSCDYNNPKLLDQFSPAAVILSSLSRSPQLNSNLDGGRTNTFSAIWLPIEKPYGIPYLHIRILSLFYQILSLILSKFFHTNFHF